MPRGAHLLLLLVFLPGVLPAQPDGRTAPQTLHVSGDTVTILRDSFGVPHVYAATLRGLFYGDGYAIAADRLWQMERYRRDARGTLAEIEGKDALPRDRAVRREGYTNAEYRDQFDALSADLKTAFTAYSDGVNAYIEQATASHILPEGFAKAGLRPAPWDPLDSVAIGVMMSHRFGEAGGEEVRNLRILRGLEKKFGKIEAWRIFDDLVWKNDPRSPTTITEEDMPAPAANEGSDRHRPETERDMFGPDMSDPILASVERRFERRDILEYSEQHGLATKLGSYAIVIGSKRSASGNPLLVGGPQMGWMTPQIAHEVHLNGAGWDVIGMGFAGIPGVLIGHNAELAWTTTSGIGDLVDTYEEKLDPHDRHRYLFNGRYRDMECRTEPISVRGGEPEKLEVCRTVHGPVIEWDEKAGIAYTKAAAFAGHELDTIKAILAFDRARTVPEFGKSASLIWLSHNFFAADRQGNIGYWYCGRYPLRPPKYDPRLPLPGTGEAEWRGLTNFANLPHVINPARGYLANWNNKPAPWVDNGDEPVWGEVFRIRRVQQLIESEPKHTAESLRRILEDIGMMDRAGQNAADLMKPRIVAAVEHVAPANPGVLKAVDYLRAWNNRVEELSIGQTIFDAWLREVRNGLFKDDLGDVFDEKMFPAVLQPSVIWHVLEGDKSGVPSRHDYLKGRSADQVIVEALERAVAGLKKKSADMASWGYHNPMNKDFKPLAPIPAQNRGTYIQIVETGEKVTGVSILPPGQNEDPKSPHYSDQLQPSSWWMFKPMITDRTKLEHLPPQE